MSNIGLGFGIIGCGVISDWHAKAVMAIKGAILVGATDVNENSRNTFALKYNIKAYESVKELLSDSTVDVVCICTPSGLHAPLSIEAAKAGKHIIVEKPMALNLKEADDIINACLVNGVKMAVISQLRFSTSIVKLKEVIDNRMLGRLVTGDIYMKYYRSQEYYNSSSWRGTWKMDGGGALMNQGIHGVDVLQYIMGPVKTVFAHCRTLARSIEVEDTASAVVEFKNGALGIIQGTTSVYPGMPRRLEVSGDKGTIVIEESSIVKWAIEGQSTPEDIVLGNAPVSSSSDPAALSVNGHIMQISDMVHAINNNQKPFVDQYEGRKPIEIITAIYESSRTGKMIEL